MTRFRVCANDGTVGGIFDDELSANETCDAWNGDGKGPVQYHVSPYTVTRTLQDSPEFIARKAREAKAAAPQPADKTAVPAASSAIKSEPTG